MLIYEFLGKLDFYLEFFEIQVVFNIKILREEERAI